jgi:zinc transport system ATP-binding protein
VVGWNQKPLLPPINVTIEPGRFVAVVGRNGSGKTTWFKTLLGQAKPISGTVERAERLQHIAYVPQAFAFDRLLPLRAWDVVMQGRLYCNNFLWPLPSKEDRSHCERALEQAGASDLARATFRDLSRGQRQRIMFARMLATEAELAMLDEPSAAMDVVAERDAFERLALLAAEHSIAVLCVSHALSVAEDYADDVLLFDRGAQEVMFGPREEVLESDAHARLIHGAKRDD